MAKTCYLIHKANQDEINIEAVVGVEAAKRKAARMIHAILVTGADRLHEMNNAALLQIFNVVSAANDLPTTKRFESKKIGAKRTLALLDQTYGAKVAPYVPEPVMIRHTRKGPVIVFDQDKQVYGRNARGINLDPTGFIKEPRDTSKRAAVLNAIMQEGGATHAELSAIVGNGRNHVRVFLHDLNRRCGYGIKTTGTQDANNRYIGYTG